MEIWEVILLGVALSMDAFAVSICKGLCCKQYKIKQSLIVGGWFGFFQGLMPLLGFLLASLVAGYIVAVDHWIAFVLLSFIGGKMIYESFKDDDEGTNDSLAFKAMLPLAVGTSIDAMAAGITMALTPPTFSVFIAVGIIGIITFAFSALGVKIGNIFGEKFKKKAEIFGGVVLILLGLKILIEHLFF
ncbi:MAG: manganese efflux pump [Clostridia bacterium]|nr:manganese efflux pump [Clostridia bacterium]